MALGVALPVLLLAPWLLSGDLLAPTGTFDGVLPGLHAASARLTHLVLSDATYQFLPWEIEVRHALRHLRLPLWSDRLDGGSSPWVNPQAAVLSPIAMLARLAPIQHFLLITLALKILVACEGTWLLARRLGRSRLAARLAAGSFSLGGGILAWALFPHSAAAAWTPWLTLGAIAACRRPSARVVATTALLVAAILLAGHPETALAGGLFAAVCGLGLRRHGGAGRADRRGGFHRADWRRGLHPGLAAALGAALCGGGLAAPTMVPFLYAVPGSQRARDMLAAGPPAQHHVEVLRPASWFLPASAAFLRAPVSPLAYGLPYGPRFDGPYDWVDGLSGYAGLAAFAGALVAACAVRDRRLRPFLAFAAGSLLVVSGFFPFAAAIRAVPALWVPAWPRLLPVGCLGIAVAAAFGWDSMLAPAGARRRHWPSTVPAPAPAPPPQPAHLAARRPQPGATAFHLGLLAAAAAVSLAVDHSAAPLVLWALLAGVPLAARRSATVAALLLASAASLDLVSWSLRLLPHGEPSVFYPPNPLVATLRRETGGGAFRVAGMDRLAYPSLLPVYGLAELRPNDPLAPREQLAVLRLAFGFAPTAANYYASFARVDHPLLSFLNVRAVVGSDCLPPPRGLTPIAEPGGLPFVVFRNDRALPRWFVPSAVDVIAPRRLAAWLSALRDPGRVAVYGTQLGGGAAPGGAGVPRAARLLAGEAGHLVLAVPGEGRRLLATSLPSPAGWRPTAGARELPKLTVDGAFLGVVCPPGVTRLALDYVPPGLGTGVGMCAAALAVLAGLLWRAARPVPLRARRRRAGARRAAHRLSVYCLPHRGRTGTL